MGHVYILMGVAISSILRIWRANRNSRLERQAGTDFVGVEATALLIITGTIDLLGVKGEAKAHLHTRSQGLGIAQPEDTSVVDLGLDEGSVVKIGTSADFQRDVLARGLRVVDTEDEIESVNYSTAAP